jgi:hypothetical protein
LEPDPERKGSGLERIRIGTGSGSVLRENRIGEGINLWFCLGFGLFDTCTRFILLCSLHRIPGMIHESLLGWFITFEHLKGIFHTTRVPTMLVACVCGDDLTISPLKQHGESMEALKSKLEAECKMTDLRELHYLLPCCGVCKR